MPALSDFRITSVWPAKHPDRLQLYSFPTPNGVKVSIMLEETGLPYEAHTVKIGENQTWTPEFLSLNPNGKIPAILDPNGPGGKPFALFESGAILVYLADKTGQLMPADPALRYETLQKDDVDRLMRGEQMAKPTVADLLAAESARVKPAVVEAKPKDEPETGLGGAMPSPARN